MKTRARGLTLLELLITFSIFGLILTLTLYFYGQSTKATRRHDQGSEVYRRAHTLFGDIEGFLHSGTFYHGSETFLVVCPFRTEGFLLPNGLLAPPEKAQTLAVTEEGLDLHNGNERREFFRKKTWERLSFSPHLPSPEDPERRRDYVTLVFAADAPSETRGTRPYEFRRQVLLERY